MAPARSNAWDKEGKRRADVVGIFPNGNGIVRLINIIPVEANDEWHLQHRYMPTEPMAELTPPMIDVMPRRVLTVATSSKATSTTPDFPPR